MQRPNRKPKLVPAPRKLREMAEGLIGEPLIGTENRRLRDEKVRTRQAAQMSILYHDHGWSLEQVGDAFSRSRERVRQIFGDYGLPIRAANQHRNYPYSDPDREALRRLRQIGRDQGQDTAGI